MKVENKLKNNKNMEKTNKEKPKELSIPTVILIASLVLGGFYYASQRSKQSSIESQQGVNNVSDELKLKQDECSALADGVMKAWSNVMGVTYDDKGWKECVVTFIDSKTNKTDIWPLRLMETIK